MRLLAGDPWINALDRQMYINTSHNPGHVQSDIEDTEK